MKKIVIIIFWLSPLQLLAQTMWYEGGKGDGHSLISNQNFTPQLTNNLMVYTGGKSDGHSQDGLMNFTPSLIAKNTPYVGGTKDGHASSNFLTFQRSLIDNYYAYQGGTADGNASDGATAFQPNLVNNFYPYLGGQGDGWSNSLAQSVALPLVLLSFEGSALDDHNELRWTTSMEENVDYFLVEKSRNGLDFASIGSVNAVGNSVVKNDYNFNDNENVQGVNYYQLRMTDIDKKFTYSKVIKLINEQLDYSVLLAPNPANENISIRLSRALKTNSEFVVLDISGKVMLREKISKDEAVKNIDIHRLAAGQYLIYMKLGNDKVSLPFVKQ